MIFGELPFPDKTINNYIGEIGEKGVFFQDPRMIFFVILEN